MTPPSIVDAPMLVRKVLEDFRSAISNRNAAAAIALLADDAVNYDLAPPLALDHKATHDSTILDRWFATWDGTIEIRAIEPKIAVDGDLACAFCLQHMAGRRTDGTTTDLWYRTTVLLRRAGGRWRIAHLHNSVPMAMDGSGKSKVDLTP